MGKWLQMKTLNKRAMIAFKLAFKNLIGAGLRTLLIVFVLSLAYVLIIYMNGLYQGWDRQARIETIASTGAVVRNQVKVLRRR